MLGRKSERERFAVAAITVGDDVSGIVLCVDGPIVTDELGNSIYPEDWLTGNPPGAGLWVWEGTGYHSYRMYDGDCTDPSLDGQWRRPTARETWLLMHGKSPWSELVAC